MKSNAILVTGGAGYIGSHVAQRLREAGETVVVLDDLSTGFAEAVLHGTLVKGSTGNQTLVRRLLDEHAVDTVLHFAAKIVVPESMAEPLKYYRNNTAYTERLLECCARGGVQHFIFSSTAAVYGIPDDGVARETTPPAPINPYGCSKLMAEWILRDMAAAGPLRYVALRYFNVAGADPSGRLGQSTPHATHLIKVACQAALGWRPGVTIFGTDYATPDGTGVRDYIHVEDLARAHLAALAYLRGGQVSTTLNCGYGHGFSVRQVLQMVEKVASTRLRVTSGPRRPGDPPMLITDSSRIRSVLGWTPRYDDLEFMISTAFEWERRLNPRPGSAV